MASESNDNESGHYYDHHDNYHKPVVARTCYFYKENDYKFAAVKLAINPKNYKSLGPLFQELSQKVPGLPYGVRSVFTPRGRDRILAADDFADAGHYVCSSNRMQARKMDLQRVHAPTLWHLSKPKSGLREYNAMLAEFEYEDSPRKRRRFALVGAGAGKQPKKVRIMKNGDPTFSQMLLLNRRTAQTFDQVLSDLSEMFKFAVRKLYTIEGRPVLSLTQLFNGPDVYVAAGIENFKSMMGFMYTPQPPARGVSTNSRHPLRNRNPNRDSIASRVKDRRNRIQRTRGRWKVWITTNELSTAGTLAQVTVTVYGYKGNSGPLPLGFASEQHFQSGNTDEFDISVGNIGEISKIRLAHDNTGDFPGWLCDEVRMKDIDTGEELVFPCKRWLDRDEDDHEICRELPVIRKGEPTPQVMKYEVCTTTGDLWNGGTDANVYLTIYGDRGDTGVRQLYSTNKKNTFQKGQTDTFHVEAVSLGRLKRIIIGHDGTKQGAGWFLEKISVKEPGAKPHEVYNFYCGRWLDEGEDDGKIVRELRVQEEYVDDIMEKRNWDQDKWKFDNRNEIILFSQLTNKVLRIKPDGTVDALGDVKDATAVFVVHSKKAMTRVFSSKANPAFHLAIDGTKLLGHGQGGSFCEFRVRIQADWNVMLEAIKHPLQFITMQENGKAGEVRGMLDKDPSRLFCVYCKGMFRNKGVVMLRTSSMQAVSVEHDKTLLGTGRCNRAAHFRVHRVGSGGLCMFESMIYSGNYLRLNEGKIDCLGGRDELSQFIVEKYKDKGYVAIQSASQRGIYIGLTPEGIIRPTVNTGVKNIWIYPEVIEFGESKEQDSPKTQLVPVGTSPKPTPSPKQEYEDGDWKIVVSSAECLDNGDLAIVVYGDKDCSGPIILAAPTKNGPLFQAGSNDEFKTNLAKVGKIYKVRLELIPKTVTVDPSWKVREVKMLDMKTKEQLKFQFNRWMSRKQEDGEIMRELPAIRSGQDVLPVLTYVVRVTTGKDDDAQTLSDVYLTVYGDRGDTGKRLLLNSNCTNKFRSGQVDVFEVEAVHLGKLKRCEVGHDGTGAGEGWYLDQIVIRESDNAKEEYIFPCDKWLDSSKEDRRIQRTLHVKEPAPTRILGARIAESPEHVRTPQSEDVHTISPAVALAMAAIASAESEIAAEYEELESAKSPAPKKESIKAGDWKVWVTTGKRNLAGTQNEVILFAYGDFGHAGPIVLGGGDEGHFQSGDVDEFKVNLGTKLGDLYKIRIGIYEAIPDSGWFLEKVKMTDLNSKEELNFKVNRWLSRSEDDKDVWRELPVVRKGQKPLPVYVYQIEVQTGKQQGADTDAAVNITLYGERGDSGKRRLFVSKSNKDPFRRGKTDVFEVEAVSLGDLKKIYIGHDGTRAGAGWFLDNIIIKENADKDSKSFFFPCNRWLDSGQDDKRIERELYPQAPPSDSKGEYKLWVKTATDSKPAKGGTATIAMYGELGNSEDIVLSAPSSKTALFEPGNVDEFEVSVGEIGDLYKIRISREDNKSWDGWHLQEVKLLDKNTAQEYTFLFDRWMGRGVDDSDLSREMAVVRDGRVVQQVCHYQVTVFTGDHWAGGTDADVYIKLIGKKGDTGKRMLYESKSGAEKFRKGESDMFELESVGLDDLMEVVVGHNGKGHGSGWYLDQVMVKEKAGARADMQYVFPCARWLDDGEGDGKTECTLRCLDSTKSGSKPKQKKPGVKSKGEWTVRVKTGDLPDSGTSANVFLTVCGTEDSSKALPLTSSDADCFAQGKTSEFKINVGQIGEIRKIRLEHDNKNSYPSWLVDYIKMSDNHTGEEVIFYLDRWLSDENGGQLTQEVAVSQPGKMPLPVLQYVVIIQTGSERDSGAPNGTVSINLFGKDGDTSVRPLLNSLAGTSSMWKSRQKDIFIIEAVSVGTLEKIQLTFNGKGKEKQWYVDSVCVLESRWALAENVFHCNCWLRDVGLSSREFFSDEVQMTSGLLDDVLLKSQHLSGRASQGRWTAWVYTGQHADAGTSDKVCIVLYGTTGHTSEKILNQDGALNADSVLKQKLNVGSIGFLFKVRIYFDSRAGNSSWLLDKLILKDDDTGEEFVMEYRDWIKSSEDDVTGAVELPAVRPDIQPLSEITYEVTVTTGDKPVAETEAEVLCTLIGDWGDSGEKTLVKSTTSKYPFERGQRDKFQVKSLDLGILHKILIGHNMAGRGRGWHCERVSVSAADGPKDGIAETIFLANRWFDTGCEDRKIVRELSPFVQLKPIADITSAQKSKSKGVWDIWLTMASEEQISDGKTSQSISRPVSITVYGTTSVSGPLQLTDGKKPLLEPGRTEKFSAIKFGKIGDMKKIRLTCGTKSDSDAVWAIRDILMVDVDSAENLVFDFSSCVGQIGDGNMELPVIKPDQPFPPIIKYQVEVHTGNDKQARTNSKVYINIHGSHEDCGMRHIAVNTARSPNETFTVDSVYLGDLEKINIVKEAGDSWFLEKIVVKAGEFDNTEWIFEHNDWVGDNKKSSTEEKITLSLSNTIPSLVAIPSRDQPLSRGQWQVKVWTGDSASRGPVDDLAVVMCGTKSESQLLGLRSNMKKPFQPGQTDICKMSLSEDIGELFKVRIGFKDNTVDKAFNLNKIQFEDEDTHDKFYYHLNDWVTVDKNQDGWREFPVVWPAIKVFPVLKYQVCVHLGEVHKNGHVVYIEIYGENGNTGRRLLKHTLNHEHRFSANQVDLFEVEAVCLLKLKKVVIGHSTKGTDCGWFLKRVVIRESSASHDEVNFECNRWLDEGKDDGRLERTLVPSERTKSDLSPPLVASPKKSPSPPKVKGTPWTIWTTTGSKPGHGMNSTAVLILYGERGVSKPLPIGDAKNFKFKEGATDKFSLVVEEDIGDLFKVRVGFLDAEHRVDWYSDFDRCPSWYLQKLKLKNMTTGKEYTCDVPKWIKLEEFHDFWTEFPLYSKDKSKMLPVREYQVYVKTADERFAGTDANVYLQIYGERGDTGKRHLHGSRTDDDPFEQGGTNLFIIEAVDLGKLGKVKVGHDGYGHGSGWLPEEIVIQESEQSPEKYIFKCNRWLDEGQDDGKLEREFLLSDVKDVSKSNSKRSPKDGVDWRVFVTTSKLADSGTDSLVYITVYGEYGNSGMIQLNSTKTGLFKAGHTDQFDIKLDPEEIGKLMKIRLEHDNSGSSLGWRVDKVVMVNLSTKLELEFPVNRWMSFNERFGDIIVEVPAKYPKEAALDAYKYVIQTRTSDARGAGTDANVYIMLIGQLGDSGKRFLKDNLENENKFESGKVDTFCLEAVDLGPLESIIIGHDGSGPASGWKLDSVTVKKSNKEVFYFPFHGWLDVDDGGMTEVEIALDRVMTEDDLVTL